MKAIFLLAMLLLAGSVRAWNKGGSHRPKPKPVHDPVQRCMKTENCLGQGWKPVCATNGLDTGAFPNKCFMRCANKAPGVQWTALYHFKTTRHCIANWTSDPACSVCPAPAPMPEPRPPHHGGHGGKGKGGKH